MTLLDQLIDEGGFDAAACAALRHVLHAAADEPRLLQRAQHDPWMRPLAAELQQLTEALESRSDVYWRDSAEAAREALQHCQPWMVMADGKANDAFRELGQRIEGADTLRDRGDPFARIEAGDLADEVRQQGVDLLATCKQRIAEAIEESLVALERFVENAGPSLRATDEWVEAKVASREGRELLDGLADAEGEEQEREILETVRHRIGVQADLLDVVSLEIGRRDKQRAQMRDLKETEDQVVLKTQRDRLSLIHVELGASFVLAVLFAYWSGPLLILTTLPAIFALLNARDARNTLGERIWSIPRGDVDKVSDELMTRMLIAGLMILGVAVVMVIRWMVESLG
jgi:hypothetical protein